MIDTSKGKLAQVGDIMVNEKEYQGTLWSCEAAGG